MNKAKLLLVSSFCALSIGSICPAAAQTTAPPPPTSTDADANGPGSQADGGPANGDIIVTAQRRAESVQKIPLAVSAVGGDALAARGISNLGAVSSSIPSLNVSEQVGQARLTLRGIGVDNISTGAESSVAFNQDGVFYSRSGAALASFYDVNRVEVLRGPQGTLYGRNATGGSVNIITNRPTFDTTGGISISGGNYSTINADGFISGKLTNTLAVRLSGEVQNHSGYGTNLVTGTGIDSKHSQAVRGQLLFEPDKRLSILLAGDFYRSRDRSNTYHYLGAAGQDVSGNPIAPTGLALGGFAPRDILDVASAVDPRNDTKYAGARLDINFKLTDDISLRSLSAYRYSDFAGVTDISPLAVQLATPLYDNETSDQYSQEFQFNWDTSNNKLVAGLFYLNETIKGRIQSPFDGRVIGAPAGLLQGFYAGGTLKTDAFAAYTQDTYNLTSSFHVTLGLRYSVEKKQVADQGDFDLGRPFSLDNLPRSPIHRDSRTFNSFTPKIGVDVDLGPRTLLYASFSKGFKAGTYNVGSMGPALNPEKVDAYEAGLKFTSADRVLRANIAGFYYDYTDLQVGKVQGQQLILENAATARIYGVEGEFTLEPIKRLQFELNASWLHARFRQYVTADQARPGGDGRTVDENGVPAFNLSGNSLPQAPNYTINLAGQYSFDVPGGSLTLRGESYWSDRVYFSPFNRDVVSQAPYNLQNAYLTFNARQHWRLSFYIRNIADKRIASAGQVATTLLGSPVIGFVKPPRTFGATFGYSF